MTINGHEELGAQFSVLGSQSSRSVTFHHLRCALTRPPRVDENEHPSVLLGLRTRNLRHNR